MQRTKQQNKAMHLFFREVADELNDRGYSVNDRQVIRMDIPFTPEIIKELMWKRLMFAMFPGVTSTKELSTKQVDRVYEVFNRMLADNWHVHIPFPSIESLIQASEAGF